MRFETQTAQRALLAGAIAGFGAVPAAAVYQWDWTPSHVWDLCLLAGIAVLFAIAAATGTRLLVDERGRWSLARLQLLTWTVLLLPTFWTMTLTAA